MSKNKQFVLGTSKLLTRSGYIPIEKLHGLKEKVQTWNGKKWSNVTITSENVFTHMYEIKFNTGHQINVSEHVQLYQPQLKFIEEAQLFVDTNCFIENEHAKSFTRKTVPVSNLKVGDQVVSHVGLNLNVLNDLTNFIPRVVDPVLQYVTGAASTFTNKSESSRYIVDLEKLRYFKKRLKYEEDPNMLYYMETGFTKFDKVIDVIDFNNDILNQYVVPLSDLLNSRLNWLSGYIDNQCVDMVKTYNNTGKVVLFAHNIKFAQQLQLLFHSLGVHTVIKSVRYGDSYHSNNDDYDLSSKDSKRFESLSEYTDPHSRVLEDPVFEDPDYKISTTCYLILETNDMLYLKQLGLKISDHFYINYVEPKEYSEPLTITSITSTENRLVTLYSVSESAGGMVTIDGVLMKAS